MKFLILILTSVLSFSVSANTLQTVAIPVASKEVRQLVLKSVEGFLNYEGTDIVTEVISDLKDPKIVIIEKDGDQVKAIEITSTVDVDVMVPEYLEVLSTRSVFCQTRIEKIKDGPQTVESICDFNPAKNDVDFYGSFEGGKEE